MNRAFEKKTGGFILKIELKKPKVRLLYWCMFIMLVGVSLIALLPPLWILLSGFKDLEEFYSIPPTIIPRSFHLSKLTDTWREYHFIKYYLNTIIQAVGEWACCILFNGLAGYVLSRLKPKGSGVVFVIITYIMMMPNTIGMVPLFMTIMDFPHLHFSMMGTYFPMWLMAGANTFYIILFKSFFDSISKAYIEAARIDGLNELGIFFKIVVPMSIPVIMVMSIFSFNSSWSSFFWPYMVINDPERYNISTLLYKIKSANLSLDVYMIILTFSIIPPAIVYAFLQKYIMTGFSLGGLKG